MQHLKPISGNHSISRVIATFFLPQTFLKPKDIFEKLMVHKNYINYQRRNLTKLRTINLNEMSQGSSDEKENGFVFEEFDIQTGKLKNIFRVLNNTDKQSSIVFETRIYENWDKFKNRVFIDVDNFSKTFNFYVEAISLNYIDEFIWNSAERIDVQSIFNEKSDILNTSFKSSDNGTLILISQNDITDNNEEKTEVSFSNKVKRITINHQYAKKFEVLETFEYLYNNKMLEDNFDKAHNSNKAILKDILSKESQAIINL